MTVRRIINEKGANVITVAPDSLLSGVAEILAQKRIGAVVVVENGAICGIASERDIVRAVAKEGGEGLNKSVRAWMSAKVTVCALDDTINDVMQMMTAGRFRHVPVVEDSKLVGIISIGDVVKRRIEDVEREAEQIREYIATA